MANGAFTNGRSIGGWVALVLLIGTCVSAIAGSTLVGVLNREDIQDLRAKVHRIELLQERMAAKLGVPTEVKP